MSDTCKTINPLFSSTEIRDLVKNDLQLNYSLPCAILHDGNDTHCFIEETDISGQDSDDLHRFEGEYYVHSLKLNVSEESDKDLNSDDNIDDSSNSEDNKDTSKDMSDCNGNVEDILQVNLADYISKIIEDRHDQPEETSSIHIKTPSNLFDFLSKLYTLSDIPKDEDSLSVKDLFNDEKRNILFTSKHIYIFNSADTSKEAYSTLLSSSYSFIPTTHNNIMPLYAMYKSNSSEALHMISPYFHNTLSSLLTYNKHVLSSPGSRDIILRYLIYQLIQGVEYLHSQGIPHGNLLPSNIYITDSMWIYLSFPSFNIPHSLSISNVPVCSYFENDKLCLNNDFLSQLNTTTILPYIHLWREGKISNFDYILMLNYAAGRKIDDALFHPVFPWVCDFTSETEGWRDFSRSKFRINKGDNQLDVTFSHSIPPHHISESLSELTYAIYMGRRLPLSLLKRVVRSNFQAKEYPSNMARMYQWTPDECIPEFFSDPTTFVSLHESMPDIDLPSWCQTTSDFIKWHRSMLESDHVSLRLHHWIDLNFGYKLSGDAAIASKNVPLKQENVKGLTKSPGFVQLFEYPHPQCVCHKTGESFDRTLIEDAQKEEEHFHYDNNVPQSHIHTLSPTVCSDSSFNTEFTSISDPYSISSSTIQTSKKDNKDIDQSNIQKSLSSKNQCVASFDENNIFSPMPYDILSSTPSMIQDEIYNQTVSSTHGSTTNSNDDIYTLTSLTPSTCMTTSSSLTPTNTYIPTSYSTPIIDTLNTLPQTNGNENNSNPNPNSFNNKLMNFQNKFMMKMKKPNNDDKKLLSSHPSSPIPSVTDRLSSSQIENSILSLNTAGFDIDKDINTPNNTTNTTNTNTNNNNHTVTPLVNLTPRISLGPGDSITPSISNECKSLLSCYTDEHITESFKIPMNTSVSSLYNPISSSSISSFISLYDTDLCPIYISPERYIYEMLYPNSSFSASIQDDLWHVGAIIAELYLGHPLFNHNSLLSYIQGTSLSSISGFYTLPEPIRTLVTMLLSLDPKERPLLSSLKSGILSYAVYKNNPKIPRFPDLKLFPNYFQQLYTVLGSYFNSTSVSDTISIVNSNLSLFSNLYVTQLPLILPLIVSIQQSSNSTVSSLFLPLFESFIPHLHPSKIDFYLLPLLNNLLESTSAARASCPLNGILSLSFLRLFFTRIGGQSLVKYILPYILEYIISNKLDEEHINLCIEALYFIASSVCLTPSIATRIIIPTLIIKTGAYIYRDTNIEPWSLNVDISKPVILSPPARALIRLLPLLSTESLIALLVSHLLPKAYSYLSYITPTNNKNVYYSLSIYEILSVFEVLNNLLSEKQFIYNVLSCPSPRLSDILNNIYLPSYNDDPQFITSQVLLLTKQIGLYYSIAARFSIQNQMDYIYNDLLAFFYGFHNTYMHDTHNRSDTKSIYNTILEQVKIQYISQYSTLNKSVSEPLFYDMIIKLLNYNIFEIQSSLITDANTLINSTQSSSFPKPSQYKNNNIRNINPKSWYAGQGMYMIGASSGYHSGRCDIDIPVTLQYALKEKKHLYDSSLYSIKCHRNENIFVTAGIDTINGTTQNIVKLWSFDKRPIKSFTGFTAHDSHVHSMDFLFSTSLIAACAATLSIYNYETNQFIYHNHLSKYTSMFTSNDSITGNGIGSYTPYQHIYTSSVFNDIFCNDLREKSNDIKTVARWKLTPNWISSYEQSPYINVITSYKDMYIISGWSDGNITMLDQRTGSCLYSFQAHTKEIKSIEFLSRDRMLTCCIDGSLSIWSLKRIQNSIASKTQPYLLISLSSIPSIPTSASVSLLTSSSSFTFYGAVNNALYTSTIDNKLIFDPESQQLPVYLQTKQNTILDGITQAPLSKLRLNSLDICPLRRIALLGSDEGDIYIVQ